jgi:hypothetical protein
MFRSYDQFSHEDGRAAGNGKNDWPIHSVKFACLGFTAIATKGSQEPRKLEAEVTLRLTVS